MHPKTPISIPNFPELSFSSKSERPSSSLYQCLSIGLLEILVAFKLNPRQIASTYASLTKILTPVTELIESKDLNADILKNYSGIINVIFEEKSQSKAFSYLIHYSELNDPNYYISLEYGLRFILAYLLQKNEEYYNLIINDQPLLNYSEALELFTKEVKIAVILIENSQKTVFCDKSIQKLPNLFILKDQDSFELLNTAQYFQLENSNYTFEANTYPFLTEQKPQIPKNPVINLNQRKNTTKRENFIKKKPTETSIQPILFNPIMPEPLNSSQILFSTLKKSTNGTYVSIEEKLSSFQISTPRTIDNPDPPVSQNSSDSPILIQSPKIGSGSPGHSNIQEKGLNKSEDISDIKEAIKMRVKKLRKFLKLFVEILKIQSLDDHLDFFIQDHGITKRISVAQIDLFFQKSLPDQAFGLDKITNIREIIHRPFKSAKLTKSQFWKLIISCDIIPRNETVNKSLLSKAISKLIAFIILNSKDSKNNINILDC